MLAAFASCTMASRPVEARDGAGKAGVVVFDRIRPPNQDVNNGWMKAHHIGLKPGQHLSNGSAITPQGRNHPATFI